MALTEINRIDLDEMAERIVGPASQVLAETTVALLAGMAATEIEKVVPASLCRDPEWVSYMKRHTGYVIERVVGLMRDGT